MAQTAAQRAEKLTVRYAEGLAEIDAGAGPGWAADLAAAVRAGERPSAFARRTERDRSSVYAALNDPHRDKARKRKGTFVCSDCAGEFPSDGSKVKPKRCDACARSQNAERNAEIIRRWNDGEPEWFITEEMGLAPGTAMGVIQCARERGEEVQLHRKRNRSDWPEIERLYHQGLTYREIGERIGDSLGGVRNKVARMREVGYDLPTRWRSRTVA